MTKAKVKDTGRRKAMFAARRGRLFFFGRDLGVSPFLVSLVLALEGYEPSRDHTNLPLPIGRGIWKLATFLAAATHLGTSKVRKPGRRTS